MTAEYPGRAVDVDDPAAPVVSDTSADRADSPSRGSATGNDTTDDVDLLPSEARRDFEARWREIQAMFVDDPRQAVDGADALVAEVAQSLTAGFSKRKAALEQHAGARGEPETEELRRALQSYRALFERVLRI
jgi:hypothetical protein